MQAKVWGAAEVFVATVATLFTPHYLHGNSLDSNRCRLRKELRVGDTHAELAGPAGRGERERESRDVNTMTLKSH